MLKHMETVDAHISKLEALTLYRQVLYLQPDSRILEIGSFKGASTAAMAHAALQKGHVIYCIDPWTDYEQQSDFINNPKFDMSKREQVLFEFRHNTAFAGRRVRAMQGYSQDFAEILPSAFFDMIFIDGAHDYESVRADMLLAFRCLKPGGLLSGHDFHSMGVGVKKAVNEMISASPSIRNKGVFEDTFIWYAVVEEPEYELAMIRLMEQYSEGRAGIIESLESLMQRFGRREELLKLQIALQNVKHAV